MEEQNKMSVHMRLAEYLFDTRKLDVNYYIARAMLDKISNIHTIKISEIAHRAHTSPASVTKFCKKLGYSSFKSLKSDYLQYRYANMFEDVLFLSGNRGVDAAFHYFAEENKRKVMEIFRSYDHEQLIKIAERLRNAGRAVILSGLHGFAAANFFLELSHYYGISIYEMNRESDIAMIQSVLETEKLVFIISLSGKSMDRYIEELVITPELADKIILVTYLNDHKYNSVCSEYVCLDKIDEFFSSNYYSSTTLLILFLAIVLYINDKK